MVNNAEKFKDEYKAQKERVAVKNGLEAYIFNMKSSLDQDEVKTKLSASDTSKAKKPLGLCPSVVGQEPAWREEGVYGDAEGA